VLYGKSSPINSTHYVKVYPQLHDDRIMVNDSVTSCHPTYTRCRLAEASDPWLRHFWTNSAFRPPPPPPRALPGPRPLPGSSRAPANWSSLIFSSRGPRDPMTSSSASLLHGTTASPGEDSQCAGVIHDELQELERFAASFKARRIRLGFTQTNVGQLLITMPVSN